MKKSKKLDQIKRKVNRLQTTVGDLVRQMQEQTGWVVLAFNHGEVEDGRLDRVIVHSGFHSEDQAREFIRLKQEGHQRFVLSQMKMVPQNVLDELDLVPTPI